MSDIQHAKVTTTTPNEDGTVDIFIDSYYEKLAHTEQAIEKQFKTSRQTYLKDIITISEHITKDQSPELDIKVKAKYGEPVLIIARWIVRRESFSRR